MQPDERLYGSLMSVAGAAGDVGLAFSLLDEMEAEGLRPSKVGTVTTAPLHHTRPHRRAGPGVEWTSCTQLITHSPAQH